MIGSVNPVATTYFQVRLESNDSCNQQPSNNYFRQPSGFQQTIGGRVGSGSIPGHQRDSHGETDVEPTTQSRAQRPPALLPDPHAQRRLERPFLLVSHLPTINNNHKYAPLIFESIRNRAVSELYGCTRGDVQNLVSSAASFASCVCHFTQELDEFWAFSELLSPFSRELSMCCTSELIPLMELPSVGKGLPSNRPPLNRMATQSNEY